MIKTFFGIKTWDVDSLTQAQGARESIFLLLAASWNQGVLPVWATIWKVKVLKGTAYASVISISTGRKVTLTH